MVLCNPLLKREVSDVSFVICAPSAWSGCCVGDPLPTSWVPHRQPEITSHFSSTDSKGPTGFSSRHITVHGTLHGDGERRRSRGSDAGASRERRHGHLCAGESWIIPSELRRTQLPRPRERQRYDLLWETRLVPHACPRERV